MALIYNGNLIQEKDFHVGFDNRAFTYGDGVFETLITTNGKTALLPNHFDRLKSGICALGMNLPSGLTLDLLEKEIQLLVENNNISGQSRIKIMVWRKSGGLFSPTEKEAECLLTAASHQPPANVKHKAIIYKEVRNSYSPVSRYKTLSSLPYVMAGLAKNSHQVDDVILLDSDSHVSECLVSNIFFISGDIVYTPSILTGCKEGIMRKQILHLMNKEKIRWEEGRFKESILMEADFVFTSNVAGIAPIAQINERVYNPDSAIFNTISKKIIIGQ